MCGHALPGDTVKAEMRVHILHIPSVALLRLTRQSVMEPGSGLCRCLPALCKSKNPLGVFGQSWHHPHWVITCRIMGGGEMDGKGLHKGGGGIRRKKQAAWRAPEGRADISSKLLDIIKSTVSDLWV